ncbi:hypothetical protein V6L77_07745 [Pannonibacter sp. Pt2-lr]
MANRPRAAAIVRAALLIAESMNIPVLAEGWRMKRSSPICATPDVPPCKGSSSGALCRSLRCRRSCCASSCARRLQTGLPVALMARRRCRRPDGWRADFCCRRALSALRQHCGKA